MSFEEKQVKLRNDEFDFFYREYGKGKKILMLHGNPGLNTDFEALANLLAEKGFCCIVPDRPGFGKNAHVPNYHNNSYISVSLYSEFMDKVCEGPAYIAGYSIGAYFALRIACSYPTKVSGLGLITPYIFGRDADTVSGIPKLAKNKLLGMILNIIAPLLASGKLKKHFTDVYLPDVIDKEKLDGLIKTFGTAPAVFSTINDKNEFIQFPLEISRLRKLTCPCVVILAKNDVISSGPLHGEKFKQALKHVTIENLENVGHAALFTQPATIAEILAKSVENTGENKEAQNA